MMGTISIQEKHSRGSAWECRQPVLPYTSNKFYKNKKIHSLELFNHLLKLSAVRKVLETLLFLALGSFGTLVPKLSHGTSSKFADVRTHLRKVFWMTFSLSIVYPMMLPFGTDGSTVKTVNWSPYSAERIMPWLTYFFIILRDLRLATIWSFLPTNSCSFG